MKQFDSLCPVCGCKGPHRCDWLVIEDYHRRVSKALRVLHIAPEAHLGPRLQALPGVDYASGDIRKGVGQIQFDIRHLPFDDAPAIREMFRVLRPSGLAIIENPVASGQPTLEPDTAEERLRLFCDVTILRLYGDDYRDRLSAAGFVVEEVWPADGIAPAKREKMELYSGNVILSRKPGGSR